MILGGLFLLFVSWVLLIADKGQRPHPTGGLSIAVAVGVEGLFCNYFSLRFFGIEKKLTSGCSRR